MGAISATLPPPSHPFSWYLRVSSSAEKPRSVQLARVERRRGVGDVPWVHDSAIGQGGWMGHISSRAIAQHPAYYDDRQIDTPPDPPNRPLDRETDQERA